MNIWGPSARDLDLLGGWFSSHYHFSGNPRIEKEVVENVASYGKQLGVLTDVVLALAKGEKNEQLGRLEEMAKQIEEIKKKYSGDLEQEIRSRLLQLKREDLEVFERLLNEHHQLLGKQRKEQDGE